MYRMNKATWGWVILFALSACGDSTPKNDGGNNLDGFGVDFTDQKATYVATLSVRGGDSGERLESASVTYDGKTVAANADGDFEFAGLPVSREVVVALAAEGYANRTLNVSFASAGQFAQQVALAPLDVNSTITSNIGGVLGTANAQVVIGGNSLVDSSGAPYSGDIKVRGANFDPASVLVFGDDGKMVSVADTYNLDQLDESKLFVEDELGGMRITYPEAVADLHYTDGDGKELSLAPGAIVTVAFSLPPFTVRVAGDEIPFLRFDDEAQVWRNAGTCEVVTLPEEEQFDGRTLGCSKQVGELGTYGVASGVYSREIPCQNFQVAFTGTPEISGRKQWVEVSAFPEAMGVGDAHRSGQAFLNNEGMCVREAFKYSRLSAEVTFVNGETRLYQTEWEEMPAARLNREEFDAGCGACATKKISFQFGEGTTASARTAPAPRSFRTANCVPTGDEVSGNSVDEDCDGIKSDQDNDGFFVNDDPLRGNALADCNDLSAKVSPGAQEVAGNSDKKNYLDEDCDGIIVDLDGDGRIAYYHDNRGLNLDNIQGLNPVADHLRFTDCDDSREKIYKNAPLEKFSLRSRISDDFLYESRGLAYFKKYRNDIVSYGRCKAIKDNTFLDGHRDQNCNGLFDDVDGDGELAGVDPDDYDVRITSSNPVLTEVQKDSQAAMNEAYPKGADTCTDTVVTPKGPCGDNPCQNGGVCSATGAGDEFSCSCPEGSSGDTCQDGASLCGDGIDNDENGKTDCADPGCGNAANCTTETLCDDSVDNDGDFKTDCDDPDCSEAVNCKSGDDTELICDDGNDNDSDGDTDCADSDCSSNAVCLPEDNCNDDKDNDSDGDTDCADSDCSSNAVCLPEDNCNDDNDNDSDGDTDCADSDCASNAVCLPEDNCNDGNDNDSDGDTDCADSDCEFDPVCDVGGGQEICDDDMDNDSDGDIDCFDSDCAFDPVCDGGGPGGGSEICDDDMDNDSDGDVDCFDFDCAFDPICDGGGPGGGSEVCDDGMDNNFDDAIDCDDPQCFGFPGC